MINQTYFSQIELYFEELVQNTEYIKAFIPLSERALSNHLESTSRLQDPMLFLMSYEGKLDGNNQRTVGYRTVNFAVMFRCDSDDAMAQRKAINDSEHVILNVLSRIDLDSKEQIIPWLKNAFVKNSVKLEDADFEYFPGLYGMYCSFDLEVKNSLKYDNSFWKTEKTCK